MFPPVTHMVSTGYPQLRTFNSLEKIIGDPQVMDNLVKTQNEHLEKLSNLAQSKLFLGKEFLTWVWYLTDTSSSLEIPLDKKNKIKVELWIDDKILLESNGQTKEESLIRYGDPSQSAEAAIALESGKTVKELKLGIHIANYGEFTATLAHDQLIPKSLQLPVQKEDDDTYDNEFSKLENRIELTNLYMKTLDSLFLMFINERTDATWEGSQIDQIREWIKSKAQKNRKNEEILH
ncbi:MAG: hypothetical protein R3B45_17555 [Bdellovibrionota bacterium]